VPAASGVAGVYDVLAWLTRLISGEPKPLSLSTCRSYDVASPTPPHWKVGVVSVVLDPLAGAINVGVAHWTRLM